MIQAIDAGRKPASADWLASSENESCVRDLVKSYRERGLALCKIRPGEKLPGYNGWNRQTLEVGDFFPYDQVGILAGRLSGDLVCVDLDSPQALQLADGVLTQTEMISCRRGKQR